MRKELNEVRNLVWFVMIVLIIILGLVYCIGCSSMSIAKQKRVAMLIGQQIEFIGDGVIVKCNDGTIKEDDCLIIGDLINFALDSQNAYAKALIAMQNGTGSQEQVQKALEALQDDMVTLVSRAIALGIRVRKGD